MYPAQLVKPMREDLTSVGFIELTDSNDVKTNIANSKLYHQFGNSVTVPLIKRIAKEMIKVLDVD